MPLRRAALAMFLVSGVVLGFEVALARICAVLLQYHLSFAVVSMAVLGVGLGGFLTFALAGKRIAEPTWAAGTLLALPVAILVALVVLLRAPFATAWPVLLFLVLPVFAAAGAFQSLVLRRFVAQAGPLYAADLAGGAAGALVAVVALDHLGGPVHFALAVAVLAAIGAAAWAALERRSGRIAAAVVLLAAAAVLAQGAWRFFEVDYRRAPHKLLTRMLRPTSQGMPRIVPELGRWDATSRIDVVELDAPRGVQRFVFIDGETPTPMLGRIPVPPNAANVPLEDALAALPLRLQPPRRVLSIGTGGGHDVVLSRAFGAASIDAVELNGGVLQVMEGEREFTGDVYRQPGVRLHHAEGRLFVRRAVPGSYDFIILALAQSLVGNLQEYALSENYLYTREALEDYLRALAPSGQIAFLVSRTEVAAKLAHTALTVLEEQGLPAADCVVALAAPGEIPYDHLVLVRKGAFDAAARSRLVAELAANEYSIVVMPADIAGETAVSPAPGAIPMTRWAPAQDERPFFFHLEARAPAGLQLLLGIAIALLVVALVALAIVARRSVGRADAPRVDLRSVLDAGLAFTLLGLGFLMVEVLVLQRTILFVGFPTLNLGLVLAVFLVAAGCGSAVSARFGTPRRLPVILLALAAALALLQPLLGALHVPLDRLPLALRCVAIAAVLFPFAFAMGMPFPSLLRALPPGLQPLVPWFWGVNGVASIAGSALVVAVVLETGFRGAALLPVACYLGVAILARRTLRTARPPTPTPTPTPTDLSHATSSRP